MVLGVRLLQHLLLIQERQWGAMFQKGSIAWVPVTPWEALGAVSCLDKTFLQRWVSCTSMGQKVFLWTNPVFNWENQKTPELDTLRNSAPDNTSKAAVYLNKPHDMSFYSSCDLDKSADQNWNNMRGISLPYAKIPHHMDENLMAEHRQLPQQFQNVRALRPAPRKKTSSLMKWQYQYRPVKISEVPKAQGMWKALARRLSKAPSPIPQPKNIDRNMILQSTDNL